MYDSDKQGRLLRLLVAHGADINIQGCWKGEGKMTAFARACRYPRDWDEGRDISKHIRGLQTLIECKANVNAVHHDGSAPLYNACVRETLLTKTVVLADGSTKEEKVTTIISPSLELVRVMLDAKANPDSAHYGRSVLLVALEEGAANLTAHSARPRTGACPRV